MKEPLRKLIPYEEFDHQALLDALKGYAHPRKKVTDLLRKGIIIRVKQGLYVFGDDYRRKPYSRELLANLIYGPSYISLEYALHYHGLIPERVQALTSVTCGRSRSFATPVGLFVYRMIPMNAFRTGMDRVEIDEERSFLMAVPEKALADKIVLDRGTGIVTQRELQYYLLDDLRIDPAALRQLSHTRVAEIADHYRSRKVQILADLLRRYGRQQGKESLHA